MRQEFRTQHTQQHKQFHEEEITRRISVEALLRDADAAAQTDEERQALERARQILQRTYRGAANAEVFSSTESWLVAIRAEIHDAFCKKAARYRREVEQINRDVQALLLAISGYVAKAIGFEPAVILALVGIVLKLVLRMTLSVFCDRMKRLKSA
jgi:hypothetical protein